LRSSEQEVADPLLPELRLDVLVDRVPEVVDQQRVAGFSVPFHLGHLRHDVGHCRVPDLHQVARAPLPALVVRSALVHPQRHVAADQPLRDDVELELVRELVHHQAVELIGRVVDRHHHALADRLGKGADAFLRRARIHVLLFELAVRLEQDQLHLGALREFVPQIGADLLIRALGVTRDPGQMLFNLRVVVDLEMIRVVDLPVESVIVNIVLPEVRDERCLRGREARMAEDDDGHEPQND